MRKNSDVSYVINVGDEDWPNGCDATIKITVSVSDARKKAWGVVGSLENINKAYCTVLQVNVERLDREVDRAARDNPFNPRIKKVYPVYLKTRSDNSAYLMCEIDLVGLGDTYSQAETTVVGLIECIL